MKLVKTAFIALLILPVGVVACLEEPADEDTDSSGVTGSATSTSTGDTTTGGSQTTQPTSSSTDTSGGAQGTATSTSTNPTSSGGAGGGGSMDTGAGGGSTDTGAGGGGSTGAGGGSTDTGAGGGSDTGAGGGGSTGAGGGDTAGMDELNPDTLIPGLDGLFWAFRTTNPEDPGDFKYLLTATGEECPVGDSWATSGTTVTKEYQVMGTPGQKYTINFELRGALGLRCYADGTPTGMTADPAGINEAFYVGGQQFGDSVLNTVELAVTPAVADEAASTYFLNGIPSTSEMCDEQITYDVQYTASFVVMGDSTVTLSTHASDCTALQNCGADPAGAGCDPRIINVDGEQVNASPMQPIFDYLGGAEFYPQWLVFDIQSITTE